MGPHYKDAEAGGNVTALVESSTWSMYTRFLHVIRLPHTKVSQEIICFLSGDSEFQVEIL